MNLYLLDIGLKCIFSDTFHLFMTLSSHIDTGILLCSWVFVIGEREREGEGVRRTKAREGGKQLGKPPICPLCLLSGITVAAEFMMQLFSLTL